MRALSRGMWPTAAAVAIALMAPPLARDAVAQDRPGPTVEAAVGNFSFADDGVVNERFAGGSFRFYLLPRISVGPEVAFVQGEHHSHLMLTGNVTVDLALPVNGRPRPVTPFVVFGVGAFQTQETFLQSRFRSGEAAFTAGGGVRALVGDRVTIGAEARFGWELHLRLAGTVGLRLGR